jgi:hypothetical protein
MLREVVQLHGWKINALDGEVGSIDEILFDDAQWTVRYLVVNAGNWLSQKKVLISPMAFGLMDWERHTFNVNLTREQIQKSPDVAANQPVSRQWEADYCNYYGWPYYWGGIGSWGSYWYPDALSAQRIGIAETPQPTDDRITESTDAQLRSTKEMTGYDISAADGLLGHIEDFIVNDETWRISYLAVDTRHWWTGKKVLLPPEWTNQLNWPGRTVTVNVTREQVRNAPKWEPSEPITRSYEDALYSYYAMQRPADHNRTQVDMLNQLGYGAPHAGRNGTSEPLDRNAVLAVYNTHAEAETAVRELQKQGLDMTKLSVIGKEYRTEEDVVGYYTAGDRMKSWGKTGAFWGAMWGLLFGSGLFVIPGIGPILAAGPLVTWIVEGLEGTAGAGGMSPLGAALFSIGIPRDSVIAYETQVKAGKFVVIARDDAAGLDKAMKVLEATPHSALAMQPPRAAAIL